VFAATVRKLGPMPQQGESISVHVARVSLYQQRGQLSLVIDGFDPELDRAS
jgi:exonuclease VII large subunit